MTLHDPSKATALQSLEVHLNSAAAITRALWELLESGSDIGDDRTLAALRQLADDSAHHASAALYQFNNGERL